MNIICSDLEGVFVPEVWINVAEKTGIEELRLTTRDIQDYDVLMTGRLKILKENNLKIQDIQEVIATLDPLPGAKEFLKWAKDTSQIIIVSDTFEEFADPLMEMLDRPTLLCHSLTIDDEGNVIGYNLRQKDPKRKVIQAFKSLDYKTIAMGDSYNDVSMLKEADHGILFNAPDNVIKEFPQFPVTNDYDKLKEIIKQYL